MSLLPYSIDYIETITDIGDVDTITLFLNTREWIPVTFERNQALQIMRSLSVLEKKGEVTIRGKTLEDNYFNTRISNPNNKQITYYSFSYRCITGYLKITLKHSMVLGRTDEMIIKDIENVMSKHFQIKDKYLNTIKDNICLGRIDYKRDYSYRSDEEYYLIKQIIDIAPQNIIRDYYSKQLKTDTKEEYIVSYKSKSNRNVEFTIYDKEKEQKKKLKQGKTEETTYYQYSGTIRFEVRILNAKLNSLKYFGISKSISSYKSKEMAEKLFNYYAEQVFFTENIYRLDIAKKIINKSKEKDNMKLKLCRILENINLKGYTQVRNENSSISINKDGKEQKNYTKFNRYIVKIRNLGINPLTLKSTWTDNEGNIYKTNYKEIPNFILAENCKEEEALMLE